MGVDLFFVLSGFLITGILLDSVKSNRYYVNFYTRRILRIFPLYYFVLALFTILFTERLLPSFKPSSTLAQLSYWLYLQNWLTLFKIAPTKILGHFWSLAIEEQFYLIWPLLIFFASKHKAVLRLCIIFIGIALVSRLLFVYYDKPAYFFTFSRMDTLALGAIAAYLLRQYGTLQHFNQTALYSGVFSLIAILVVAFTQQGFDGHNHIVLIYGLLPLAIFFTCILILTITSNTSNFLRKVFQNTLLRQIGTISYGIYIFHWPIIVLIQDHWNISSNFWISQISFVIVITILSFLIAWLSYHLFEIRFLQLKDKLAPTYTLETD